MHCKRVFRAHIDDALGGSGRVAADRHALDQGMRVALQFVSIHIRTRVSLIRIADEVFLRSGCLAEVLEFQTRGKPGSSASAQSGLFQAFDDCVGRPFPEHIEQSTIAASAKIFLDVAWIDEAAVAQYEFLLAGKERNFGPGGHIGLSGSVIQFRRDMVPMLHLAQDQRLRKRFAGEPVENLVDLVWPHALQDDDRLTGRPYIDQWLLCAIAKASGRYQLDVQATLTDCVGKGVIYAFRSIPGPARSHPHRNPMARWQQLLAARISHRIECRFVCYRNHATPFRSRASNSLSNVGSFICPSTA